MSLFKREKPPEPIFKREEVIKPLIKSETEPEKKQELDPASQELHNLATRETTDIIRKVFDLESTERTLLKISMEKDSGITPDSKLSEILDYVRNELERDKELNDELRGH